MNITISLKEYVDLHDDEVFKRFMYNYSLLESLSRNDDIDDILEVHGSFENQLDLVLLFSKYIVGMIYKEKNYKTELSFSKDKIEAALGKIKGTKIENIFFEKIRITITDKENSYIAKNNLNKNGLIEEVEINLNKNDKLNDIDNVIVIFYHELLHAYDNWKRQINKSKSMKDKISELDYDKWTDKKGISKDDLDGLVHGLVKELLYMTNQIEKNAFVTELHSVVVKWKLSNIYPSYAKAIKNFKSTNQWKTLETLMFILDSDDMNDMLVKWYNEESTVKLGYSKALSKIKFLVRKCKEKYEQLVPKVYFDYIETNNKDLKELTENKREYLTRIFPCIIIYTNFKGELLCQ